ncbi:MAG: hypothetical protein QM753_12445 [Thermomicrobiales bacterium]
MSIHSLLTKPLDRRTFAVGSALSIAGVAALGTLTLPGIAAAAETEYPELLVVAKDYAFELPETVEAGFTNVTLENQGADAHHAVFLKLNDGVTVDQVAAAKNEVEVLAQGVSLGGGFANPMGGKNTIVMNLEEGNYAVLCLIPGPDGMPHYQMGMIAPLTVTAGTSTAVAPTADLKIELMEMMFHNLPETLAAGPTTWEVTNTGVAVHEMVVLQLAEGVTGEQAIAMLAGIGSDATPEASPVAEQAGPPPFSLVGVAAPMSPGHTIYAPLDLVPGNYFTVCFVFDPASGMPHALIGMQMPFTVE